MVFAFLRSPRGTLIPGVAVAISLIGTFGVMYLVGYSLDNLSLMALTISTGFVVDDAIVVMENITRLIEEGMPVMEASLQGAQEVGFTVLSMSLSLIAVFVPILFMGGIVGRIFHEFAFVLTDFDRSLHAGFAYHHADDVLAVAPARHHREAQPHLSRQRAFL